MTFFRSASNGSIVKYTNHSKISETGPWTTVNVTTATGSDAENVSDISEDTFNVTVSDEGVTTIWYYSVDNNSNVENTKNVTVKINTTPPATNGALSGTITSTTDGTGVSGVTVNLTLNSTGTVISSTTTDGSGDYLITDQAPGEYTLTASKIRFWSNSMCVTVNAGEFVTVNSALWLKGDLNNNGISADAGDQAMMKDASVGKITADWRYDFNTNGIFADAGDQAMMKDASVGKIELL
ncbi:MAG: carboxypeptidase-like regulatory domain-containing protein [Euryarchaeota archaeon]|nr:carboxypeptidase-like regulatory domain-containing protein [Euryarchaeota archaeon]